MSVLEPHRIVTGDLFASGADTLVNPVNCVGAMGAGLALQFKRRYPAMFTAYVADCRAGRIKPGRPLLWDEGAGQRVLNFPTKGHWRDPSQLEDIDAGLRHLAAHAAAWRIQSLAIPPLGCGLGGLDFDQIGPLIIKHLHDFPGEVLVYGQRPQAEASHP